MASRSRLLEMGLAVYAGAIFVILWVGAAYALLAAPDLIDGAWVWLTGLSTVPAIIAWVLGLPIAIALWAAQADLAPVLAVAVGLGLLAWTGLAIRGLLHAFRPAT